MARFHIQSRNMPTHKIQRPSRIRTKPTSYNCPGLLWSQSTGSNENPNLRTNRLSKSVQRLKYSTDVGDRSWIVPTVHLNIPTFAAGTALHSWQAVAQGKSSIAHKGMLYAAKIMALTALDFLQIQNWQIKPEKETDGNPKTAKHIQIHCRKT